MADEDEDIGRFIQQQRAKIAKERDILNQNPPSAVTDNTFNREALRKGKENRIPENYREPAGGHQNIEYSQNKSPKKFGRPPSTPRIFRLGEDYKSKKERLKEELKEDYRNAMAQKEIRQTGRRSKLTEPYEEDLGLSLPIKDRLSAKERMRLQRNREYNQFLVKNRKETRKKRKAKGLKVTPNMTPDSTPVDNSFDPPNNPRIVNKVVAQPESYQDILNRKRQEENQYRRDDLGDFEDNGEISYRSKGRESLKPAKNHFPRKKRNRRRPVDLDDSDNIDDVIDEELFRLKLRKALTRRRNRNKRHVEFSSDEDDLEDDEDVAQEQFFTKVPKIKKSVVPEQRKLPSTRLEKAHTSLDTTKQQREIDLRSKSAPPDEYTGLQIGHVQSANTVRRQKEEYRQNLLQQMEENKSAKKRERQLDLQADARVSGEFGETRQRKIIKDKSDKESGDDKLDKKNKKKSKPTVSYKLDLSSGDDSEPETRRRQNRLPRQQPPNVNYFMPPSLPAVNVPGYFQPQYMANPYTDPYSYYSSRDPLDGPAPPPVAPPTGYYQQFAQPPGVSPLMAAADSKGTNVTKEQKSALKKSPRLKNTGSGLMTDDMDDDKKRERMRQYQEDLKAQMEVKNRERMEAKAEQEAYDRKIEREARDYNPYGKGGGGAPMKDAFGNLISDLRQMHLDNEEIVRYPTKASEAAKEKQKVHREDRPVIDLSPRLHEDKGGDNHGFGRHNPFENKESTEQKTQKDIYKEILKKQIEEKRRLEDERKEKIRKEEEEQERRLEEQRLKIQAEYESELRKDQEKKEKIRRENEELQRQTEQNLMEEQNRRKAEREQRENEIRAQKERELEERLRATVKSPPIPTHQNTTNTTVIEPRPTETVVVQQPQRQPEITIERPPPVTSQTHFAHEPIRGQSPVIQPIRSQLQSRGESKRISRELSALRKQLLSEQRRVENQLKSSDAKKMFRGNPSTQSEYLVDLSRVKQKPVAVRRPPSVESTHDRPSTKALREFNDYKYRPDDTTSLRMFRAEYPESPDNGLELEKQQDALIKSQGRNLEYYRQNQSNSRGKNNKLVQPTVAQSRASLLEADTAFIPFIEDDDSVTPLPSRQQRQSSARDRRRQRNRPSSILSDEIAGPSNRNPDSYSLKSLSSLATLDVERLAYKNEDRLNKLKAVAGDEVSLTDPEEILERFVNRHRNTRDIETPLSEQGYATHSHANSIGGTNFRTRPPTVNTVESEPWLRPETEPAAAAS